MAKVSTRTELNESFIGALAANFEQHGMAVIEKLRIERPEIYAQLVAKLVPQKVEVSDGASPFDSMSATDINEWLVREYASDPETWTTFKARVELLIALGDPVVRIEIDPGPVSPATSSPPKGRRPGVPIVGR